MKTIIKIKTYMCPQCRFHRAINNPIYGNACPEHKLPLQLTVNFDDQITITVMGEEDIDDFVNCEGKIMRNEDINQLDVFEQRRALRDGRIPILKSRQPLSEIQKQELKNKIKDSISFHKQFEYK